MTKLNTSGLTFARSLIAAGSVDKNSPWSFSPGDANALLGAKGDDWANYGKNHLGIDPSAKDMTREHWKYPFAKSGRLYRSAITAIRQRSAQQKDMDVFNAAGDLLDAIDGKDTDRDGKSAKLTARVSAFEFKLLDAEGSAPVGSFEGYGSVFNNEDDNGDVVLPGAFTASLAMHKANGTMPKMLLNHGGLPWGTMTPDSMLPVGVWDGMSEDTHGLMCKGRLINLDTESGKRLYGAMKEGQIDGMSITYRVKDAIRGAKPNEPRRAIKAADLIECGPVTFPANELATISDVKSRRSDPTVREFESVLRDVFGFAHSKARAIAQQGYHPSADPGSPASEAIDALRGLEQRIRSSR